MTRPTRHSNGHNGQDNKWRHKRELVLLVFGLTLITAEFINAEVRGATFHLEFLVIGGAMCGLAAAQWGDRK